jgi:hypothetical protein
VIFLVHDVQDGFCKTDYRRVVVVLCDARINRRYSRKPILTGSRRNRFGECDTLRHTALRKAESRSRERSTEQKGERHSPQPTPLSPSTPNKKVPSNKIKIEIRLEYDDLWLSFFASSMPSSNFIMSFWQ